MKIVYFGKWLRGLICLKALVNSPHQVVGVVAEPEEVPPVLKNFAVTKGLNVLSPRDVNSPEFRRLLRSLDSDIFVLSGYTKILKQELRKIPPKGCINLHGGRLPYYRGASVLNWQVINGEKEIGLSIIYIDEGIDTGDVIAEVSFPISETENISGILNKTLEIFPQLLLETLDNIEKGMIRRKRQDLSIGYTYPKRKPEDGRILWEKMETKEIVNLIRALTPPYPGAFAFLGNKKIIIHKASAIGGNFKAEHGEICLFLPGGVIVKTKDMAIKIEEVMLESGTRPIKARELFKEIGGRLT